MTKTPQHPLETFLSKYTYEVKSNGDHWGEFADQKQLQKVRDAITQQEWQDILLEVPKNFDYLPPNLQISLKKKFEKLWDWQDDNNCNGWSVYKVCQKTLTMRNGKDKWEVQGNTWGIITSSVESEFYKRLKLTPPDTGRWRPFK